MDYLFSSCNVAILRTFSVLRNVHGRKYEPNEIKTLYLTVKPISDAFYTNNISFHLATLLGRNNENFLGKTKYTICR